MAVVLNANKVRSHADKTVQDKYAHLREEQAALQRELTTKFPRKDDLLYDKEMGFLMLNG